MLDLARQRCSAWLGRSILPAAILLPLAACSGGLEGRSDGGSGSPDLASRDVGGPDLGGQEPFVVELDTTAGIMAIQVFPSWAPLGARRVRELVESGYYDGAAFFRVLPTFVIQFGLAADPDVTAMWLDRRLPDEPVMASNTERRVSFAAAGPDTRTTQLFINVADNARLDDMGFAPIGEVTEASFGVTLDIKPCYGEMPDQRRIRSDGAAYLEAEFPQLTIIRTATIRPPE
ncbi:MAG: peptidylprolyl isomerase [Sandaracinaceae bacterium]